MTKIQQGMLKDIWNNLADYKLRLMYADYLESQDWLAAAHRQRVISSIIKKATHLFRSNYTQLLPSGEIYTIAFKYVYGVSHTRAVFKLYRDGSLVFFPRKLSAIMLAANQDTCILSFIKGNRKGLYVTLR